MENGAKKPETFDDVRAILGEIALSIEKSRAEFKQEIAETNKQLAKLNAKYFFDTMQQKPF